MVRKTSRRGKRFLVIDFSFTKPDGTEGRYRRDAAVQIMAAAQTEEAGRKLGATLYGDPEIIVDRNGVPLRPAALEVKPPPEPTFAEVVARYLVEYAKSRLACSTLDGYQSALKNHLIPKLGNHPFSVAIEVSRSRMLDVELVESGHAVSTRANIQLAFRSVIKARMSSCTTTGSSFACRATARSPRKRSRGAIGRCRSRLSFGKRSSRRGCRRARTVTRSR